MILGSQHDEMAVMAARESLCAHYKQLEPVCRGSLLPAVYRAALAHSAGRHRHRTHDHSREAIIYVVVVMVFYAVIIVLLVGTNLRRCRSRPRGYAAPPGSLVVTLAGRGGGGGVRVLTATAAKHPGKAAATV